MRELEVLSCISPCPSMRHFLDKGGADNIPLTCAFANMIPNAIASAAKRDTNGNAIHRLNSVGLTGFAMLDGLSRRCSRAVMMPFSELWMPLCVISVMLYVGSAWCIQVRLCWVAYLVPAMSLTSLYRFCASTFSTSSSVQQSKSAKSDKSI
jgi:hypothetical protein